MRLTNLYLPCLILNMIFNLSGCETIDCSRGLTIPPKEATDTMNVVEKRTLVIKIEEFKIECPNGKLVIE